MPEDDKRYEGKKVINVLVTTNRGMVTKVQRPALRLDRDKNEDKMLRVIEIEYVKFPWWKFWKKRKYVEEYHLEVM